MIASQWPRELLTPHFITLLLWWVHPNSHHYFSLWIVNPIHCSFLLTTVYAAPMINETLLEPGCCLTAWLGTLVFVSIFHTPPLTFLHQYGYSNIGIGSPQSPLVLLNLNLDSSLSLYASLSLSLYSSCPHKHFSSCSPLLLVVGLLFYPDIS